MDGIDTFHVFKKSPVPVIEPGKLTNIAEVDAPADANTSYMVFAKTEIENRGASSQVTSELVGVPVRDELADRFFAIDPVTVFAPQGHFAVTVMMFVVGPQANIDFPFLNVRFRVRCGALLRRRLPSHRGSFSTEVTGPSQIVRPARA